MLFPTRGPGGMGFPQRLQRWERTTLEMRPQVRCRPLRLLLEPAAAAKLKVCDIAVGSLSYTGCSGDLPGVFFAEDSKLGVRLDLPVVDVDQVLLVRIENVSEDPLDVVGAWECEVGDGLPVLEKDRTISKLVSHGLDLVAMCCDGTLWRHTPHNAWEPFPDKIPMTRVR